jgi:hypothetical protein
MIKVGLETAIIACYGLNYAIILPKDGKLARLVKLIDDLGRELVEPGAGTRRAEISAYGKISVLLESPREVIWVFVDGIIFIETEWGADIEVTDWE